MDLVSRTLNVIEQCIQNDTYQPVETERLELKNLAGGWGKDWYKSVCAFLNTNGGIIIVGISERKGRYKFTGYVNSESNENHLKQDLPKKFTDKNGKSIDLTTHITRFEIRDFLGGKVAIVYIEEVEPEQKYIYYDGNAYIRKLTGAYPLSKQEIERYEENRQSIIQNQELAIIEDVTLDVLNMETLNNYIYEYNRGKKRGETLKKNLAEALPFLHKEKFVIDNQATLLGILVCGDEPERYIQGKCEADCYVIVPRAPKVAQSKEIIEDNIIALIRRSQSFVWRNIQVGITYEQGGTAAPEYPESLIRESINNAFAHRDYKSNRFIIIEIRPQESLMIRNPGVFTPSQRIYLNTDFGKVRRIIPVQIPRNPKLAHLLKSFNYWEGRGRGLSSLIDACLDNEIDVPYYILSYEEIKLFIPKGRVLDKAMDIWLDSFKGYINARIDRDLIVEEKILLAFFKKSEELNRLERYTILITADNNHNAVIDTLEEKKLIVKNPNSSELYPIYQVDRTLMQNDFFSDLKAIFKEEWNLLALDYQKVLQAIYLHNNYSAPKLSVSASSIAKYIYIKEYGNVSEITQYERYKAKVRRLFNRLESKGFIVRKDGKTKEEGGKPDFKINEHFFS